MKALRLQVTGVVQGVGFRPFVYNLAGRMAVTGWVLNSSRGVFIHAEAEDLARLDGFAAAVADEAPPMAVVETVTAREADPEGFSAFEIRESLAEEGATLVSPDIATCPACLGELADAGDRRFRYPFINCTNCGPRFTIISDVPYDRPATTMGEFEMCPDCASEYADPGDRRFHAQPDACAVCGPRLYLNDDGCDADIPAEWCWSPGRDHERVHRDPAAERERTEAILAQAVCMLREGHTLAIKGLGGFHLACDATSQRAVARLRERKRRWGKPFAVMMPDLETVNAHCHVDSVEAGLLSGTVRPIVLLRLRGAPGEAVGGRAGTALARSVAPGLAELGVMLPYTPLHHLLLTAFDSPLVMTSGNLTDEPIAMDNAEALRRLGPLADAFLLHDRGVYARYDDSVVRAVDGRFEMVRRARGYAPHPVKVPFVSDIAILATGPEQKNTFALLAGDNVFVSPHIGDMENAETLEHFERSIEHYERLFRVEPGLIAYDLHPEYLSTKFALALAEERGLPAVGVQHHHAHIAGVLAEHGVDCRAAGVSFDGTGYGADGRIWGGEVMVADWAGFERFAHLRYVPMPGGASAVRRPARMALGLLTGCDLLDHPGARPLLERLRDGEAETIARMLAAGLNSPMTSSMGRLFDAVAALAGVRDDALYEGQAAIELEAAADLRETGAYEFDVAFGSPRVIDPAPLVASLLDDIGAGVPAAVVSARFHNAVVRMTARVAAAAAEVAGDERVALGGGVFMNRLVLAGVMNALEGEGLVPLLHRQLPVNDGGVSYGQAVVGWANRG